MINHHDKELLEKEWFSRAHPDEISAKALLKNKLGAAGTVCFLSQQMAEKYLKAYLVHKIKDFPKIHQLDRLVNLCSQIDPAFEELKDEAEELSAFYVTTRYPGDYPEFGWDIADRAFKQASKIKKFVLAKIHG